ncbi:MAG: aromatic amino acid ammonia-lyase [Campylobacteraceae bacterium]|nr:aromatic amino acid ammonia-lyase [Campylobacteraceae bacterium]
MNNSQLVVDTAFVTLESITNAKDIYVSEDEVFVKYINASHKFLADTIKNGKPIYGVTTGYGDSGKNYLEANEADLLQQNLYRYHGCGVGKLLTPEVSRYALIARLISLSKGYSAVSYELLKRFELLLKHEIYPAIPSQGSVGASGDLTPLSYIAAVIAGEREAYFEGEIHKTADIYNKLSIKPYLFKPKEALAVMNGTTIMSAIALASMQEFKTLLNTMESFTAGMYEVLLCDTTPLEEFVHKVKPFEGQIGAAEAILNKTKDSKLTHGRDERYAKFFEDNNLNIQDTYSMRCAPQVLGVIRDNLKISESWTEQEINSVNDNPLIDAQNSKIYTSGNFYGGYVAHAMDTLKICAANLSDLLDKEFALLVDHKFNRGLGENLKLKKENFFHGFKAMQITLSSLSADVIKNTTAASVHSRPTESLNQDKVSMGTTAALDFSKMLPDIKNMLSIALIGLAQAADIRGADKVSPFLRANHDKIRANVPALKEDRRMDIDIAKIVKLIESGTLK